MADKLLKSLNFGGEDTYYLGWDSLQDSPFCKTVEYSDTLTWNGDTTGLELNNGNMYKVTDIAPTLEELQKGVTVTITQTANGQEMSEDMTSQVSTPVTSPVIMISSVVKVVLEDYIGNNDIVITKGTYLANIVGVGHVSKVKITDYNGFSNEVVTPIDSKYLPKGLQFGSEITDGLIMSERELAPMGEGQFIAMNDSGEMPFVFPELIVGGNYTIVWNGTTYNAVGVLLEAEGISGIGLGNLGMMGLGNMTDDPFICIIANSPELGGTVMMVVAIDGSTTVTMSLSGEVEEITPLESKYLPRFEVLLTDNGDGTWSTSKTVTEIVDAFNQGKLVYATTSNYYCRMPAVSIWDSGVKFVEFNDSVLTQYNIYNHDQVMVIQYNLSEQH